MTSVEPKDVMVEFIAARLTDPRSRLSSKVETFDGDDSTKTFTLTPTSGSKIFAITSVTITAASKKKWEEYTFDPTFQSKVVTFVSAPATGTDNVSITYLEGTTSWVYPDLARVKSLTATSYPRINVQVVSGSTIRNGSEAAGAVMSGSERHQVDFWTKEGYNPTIASQVYGNDKLCMYLMRQFVLAIEDNADDLYPKLMDISVLNIRGPVWEVGAEVFHGVVDVEVMGESLGE